MVKTMAANQKRKSAKSGVKPTRERVARKQIVSIRRGAAANELAGDQAMGGGILQQRAAVWPFPGDVASPAPVSTESRFARKVSGTPRHTVAPQIRPVDQARFTTGEPLSVNAPRDRYEREADPIADALMRGPELAPAPHTGNEGGLPTISRIPLDSRETGTVYPDVERRVERMKSGGQALLGAERGFFEERMGCDVSGVRLHTDANAAQTARDLNARAFTMGGNIAFGAGAYQPGTSAGRRLLAHELTHVVQQLGSARQRLEEGETGTRLVNDYSRAPVHTTDIGRVQDKSHLHGALTAIRKNHNSTPSVQSLIQRRLTEEEKTQNLTSPRIAGNSRLERAFDNDPPMRTGEEGEAVVLVQQMMIDDGYPMPVSAENGAVKPDGIFRRETRQTVRWFQKKYDLSVDGRVGRETLQKLDELFGGTRPPPSMTPEADATQEALGEQTLSSMNRANERGRRNPNSGVWYDHQYRRMYRRSPDLYRWDEDYLQGYANPRYFDRLDYWDWRLKPNVSASDGIRAWLRGLTIAECFTVVIANQYSAIRAVVGDQKFDERFGSANSALPEARRLRIAPPPESENIPLADFQTETGASLAQNEGSINNRPVEIGEWYYIANHPKYSYKHPEGAWRGENALYVGRNRAGRQLWTGFGAANMTEKRMYRKMVGLYNLARTNRDYMHIVTHCTKPGQGITDDEMNTANHNYRALYRRYIDRIQDDYRHDTGSFENRITTRKLLDEGGGFNVLAGTTLDLARVRALRES